MSAFEKQIFMNLIEGDLQQAWELLGNDQFNLAVHHFEQATVKAKELRDMAENESPQPQQPTLDIES